MIKKYWYYIVIGILFILFIKAYSAYAVAVNEKQRLEERIKINRIENRNALEETKRINKKLKKEKGELYDKLNKIIQGNKVWGNTNIPDDFYRLLQQ